MKKQLLFWSMLISIFTIGRATNITFHDPNFENALLNHVPAIDTDGIVGISVAEAEVVLSLNIQKKNISNLSGIEYFTNLENLSASQNEIISVDLSNNFFLKYLILSRNKLQGIFDVSKNTSLTHLDLSYNDIEEIDVSQNSSLSSLNLSNNDIEEINVSQNTSLTSLNLLTNKFTEVDVSENINLINLYLSSNRLTKIEIEKNVNLVNLYLDQNELTELDLSNQVNLGFLTVNFNDLETLDVRSCSLYSLNCAYNHNLKTIFATNQPFSYIPILGEDRFRFWLNNCENLQFICAEQEYLNDIYSLLEDANQTDCMLSNDCDDPHNRIQGYITYDVDNDGCGGEDDVPFNEVLRFTASSSTGGAPIWAYPNEEGQYTLHAADDTYSFVPVLENTTYFAIRTPVSSTPIVVPDELDSLTTDYCIQPLGEFNDLEVSIFPTSSARPGFDATYLIRYKNIGTTTQSGMVTLDYQEDVLAYVSATPNVTSDTDGQLTWNFNALRPMETVEIPLTLVLNKPTDTPPLNGGEILNFTATIAAGTDETPANNVMTLAQPVVNSYDPNDKTCLEGDVLDPEDVGGYLHYLIRFENEGTAEAINIRVVDVIDTTKLEIASFVPLKSSHLYTTTITNENEVEFTFSNINLPFDDDNNDGYVLFKIKSKDTLVLGDEIVNSAAIYFDFNFPILTENSVVTVEKKKAEGIYFPDPNFKNALLNYAPAIDINEDGEISIDEAENVERLALSGKGITSVEGIEYFINLNFLNLYVNAIEEIDLSNNINLSYLYLARNALTDIDVSNNINLTHLYLASNSLKDIDVSNNINLTTLAVGDNPIAAIDISNNTNLLDLNALYTDLKNIDVSNNTKLTNLALDYCNITDIELFNNINLSRLSVSNNDLTSLDVTSCTLTYLNFSNNPNLETVYMTGQPIAYIGENLSMNLRNCPSLNFVCADQKYLTDISELLFEAGLDTCTLSDNCSINTILKIWTGIVSNDWNVKENWDTNTIPTSNDDVLIPAGLINYPTATTLVAFNTLTLEPATSFISQKTVEGQITYKVNLPITGWYGVTAPVAGETYENLIANHAFANGSGTNVGIGSYNNDKPGYDYQTTTSTGAIPVGQGIIMKLQEAGEVSFTGTMITGDFEYQIDQGVRNFNLIGNPYTSYINSTDFFNENGHLLNQQTIWVYDGSKYVTHNLVNPIDIAPGQAFFVSASTDGFVTFKESNQNHKKTTSSKQASIANFELSINSNTSTASTKVMYLEEKTIGFDNGFDSEIFNDPTVDLTVYTELPTAVNSNRLSVQTLPLDNTHAIPVGIIANAGNEITFSASSLNLPENTFIYLEDRKKGEFVNLSEAEYKTTLEKNTNGTGQFYIHTDTKKVNSNEAAFDNISIYKSAKNEATILGLNSEARITILSIAGQKVLTTVVNQHVNKISLPKLSPGIYLVKVASNTNQVIKKVLLD